MYSSLNASNVIELLGASSFWTGLLAEAVSDVDGAVLLAEQRPDVPGHRPPTVDFFALTYPFVCVVLDNQLTTIPWGGVESLTLDVPDDPMFPRPPRLTLHLASGRSLEIGRVTVDEALAFISEFHKRHLR